MDKFEEVSPTKKGDGSLTRYGNGRPVVIEDDRKALDEAVAFQIGKDGGLTWTEARSIVRKGISGRRVG